MTPGPQHGETVCGLALGHLLDWCGLQPFPADQLPACLSLPESEGWLQFSSKHALYRVHRLGSSDTQIWLFIFTDDCVSLVEVFSMQLEIQLDALLAQLGTPDLQRDYPLAAQLQRPLQRSDEELIEHVYADRGMALLVGYRRNQPIRLARVRGFEVMDAATYTSLYVDLPAVRFFQE